MDEKRTCDCDTSSRRTGITASSRPVRGRLASRRGEEESGRGWAAVARTEPCDRRRASNSLTRYRSVRATSEFTRTDSSSSATRAASRALSPVSPTGCASSTVHVCVDTVAICSDRARRICIFRFARSHIESMDDRSSAHRSRDCQVCVRFSRSDDSSHSSWDRSRTASIASMLPDSIALRVDPSVNSTRS